MLAAYGYFGDAIILNMSVESGHRYTVCLVYSTLVLKQYDVRRQKINSFIEFLEGAHHRCFLVMV